MNDTMNSTVGAAAASDDQDQTITQEKQTTTTDASVSTPPTSTSENDTSTVAPPTSVSSSVATPGLPLPGSLSAISNLLSNWSTPLAITAAVPSVPSTSSAFNAPVVAAMSSTSGSSMAPYSLFPDAVINSISAGPTRPAMKRKPGPVKGSKRVKKTIIDDEIACSIFRDLRLSNDFLNSGKVLAWALQPDDEAFLSIYDYVARGQEHGFGVKILNILRVICKANSLYEGEDPLEHQLDFNEDPNAKGKLRKMLWHGTRRNVLTSILENSLRLPVNHGQMFGGGIYFADRVSKSCQYCDHGYNYNGNIAFLFLCDVLVGNEYRANDANHRLNAAPAGYDSVLGQGHMVPDSGMDKTLDGCVWPLGPTVRSSNFRLLRYNEYIVYNTKQVQVKYLVKVQFTRTPYFEKLY